MSERVEIDAEEVTRTEQAILIKHADGECWLPMSRIYIIEEESFDDAGPLKLSVPEWLAIEKGLV